MSQSSSQPLAGRVALVTGASSGIGRAAAIALAAAGAAVALVARRADRLADLESAIAAAGGSAIAFPADVGDETAAAAVVADTLRHFGRLDIVVNAAGAIQNGGVENADTAEWRRIIEVNLWAGLYICSAAIGPMRAQGGGDIINITSLAGRKGGPETNAYSGSKHAANSMTDAMRQELGGKNIRVSILMPGATTTEVANNISNPNWRTAIQAHVAKDGAVKPEEIGQTIVFMLSLPRNAHISEISVRPTIDTTA